MTSRNRTYYEILGVSADAYPKEIRDAYRRKAREFHPDLNPDPDAVERMQEINEAYEVLRDTEQRASYDRAHRHFAATDGRLRQAKAAAVVIVGELAFHLGWDIGAGDANEWAKTRIGDENTPGALWAAVFEAVLESALDGGDTSSMQRAAREAAWTGAHNETARQARRHALYESAGSVTEAISIDISITAVGVLASTMGRQLGETGTRIKPRAQAWQDVFEAAQDASLKDLARYGEMLARGNRLRDSTFATMATHAAEAGRVALRPYAERISTDTVGQGSDRREDLWEDATRSAVRKGRFQRILHRSFVLLVLFSLLALFGVGIAASITGTTLGEIVNSVEERWAEFRDGNVETEFEQPTSETPPSVAAPLATPSPTTTATATATPTPAPTAAPTPTPVPVSPWAGFAITSGTLGKEILNRLSDEETACVQSSNHDGFLDYYETYPLGVRVGTIPPVRDVSDLPELADCLSEESTTQLNRAIAIFHDPTLAPPSPTPAPTFTPTPRPTPTARPTVTPTARPTVTPTPRPTATPQPTATPDLTRGSAGWIAALEQRIHELVNRQRTTGLGYDVELASIARSHSADMATARFFSHTNHRGQSPTDRGAQVGYNCRKDYGSYYTYGLAENIYQAWLYGSYRTVNGIVVSKDYHSLEELANLVVDGWMDSSGHRENILNTTYDVQGIGVAVNDDEQVYVTQNFC